MICDLGMPRDVDPAVAGLPGVWVVDVDRVQHEPSAHAAAADVDAARHIVAAEVAAYLAGQRMAEVTPTVTALRQRAADVVEAELLRLDNRLPGLDSAEREEVARTVRRVVDKLLHAPTVRIKQLASAPGGDSYAEALRELFELDQTAVDAVATAGELPVVSSGFDEYPAVHPKNPPSSRLAHVIRIGTRGSLLATTQAATIRDALIANGHPAELVTISHRGRPIVGADRNSRRRASSPPRCGRPSRTAASTRLCTRTRICQPPRTPGSRSRRYRHGMTPGTRWWPATDWCSGSCRRVRWWARPRRGGPHSLEHWVSVWKSAPYEAT